MRERLKQFGVALAVLVTVLAVGRLVEGGEPPVPDEQWSPETRLWLARSLLGEVGWRRPEEQEAGMVPNPCPRANHFGGSIDAWRARRARWVRVCKDRPFRNRFYDGTRRLPK